MSEINSPPRDAQINPGNYAAPAPMTMQELLAEFRRADAEQDTRIAQLKTDELRTEIGQLLASGGDLAEAMNALNQLSGTLSMAPLIPLPEVSVGDLALDMFSTMNNIFNEMAKGTTEHLKATDEARQKRAQDAIDKMKESIAHAQKAKKCGKITQIVQIIAVSLAVVACCAAVVATGGVGAPAAIALIALMVTSLDMANTIAQKEGCKTDFSLSGGFTKLGKECGMSDKDAHWFGFGMAIGLQVLMMGGSSVGVAAKAGANAAAVMRMAGTARNVGYMGTGAATAAGGVGSAVSEKEAYEAAKKESEAQECKAWVKKFQSQYEEMLELLQQAIDGMSACGNDATRLLNGVRDTNQSIVSHA